MSGEVVYMRGLGGSVFEMTLPLQPAIRKQYEARDVVQVNKDGSAYDGPRLLDEDGSLYEDPDLPGEEEEAKTPPPAGKASK